MILCSTILSLLTGCQRDPHNGVSPVSQYNPFDSLPNAYPMTSIIEEASGIADSKRNPGYLWVEQDSGNPPALQLLSHRGTLLKTIYLKGGTNRDWEDIGLASGPDSTKQYLYIADIGDNDAIHSTSYFYRFEEPGTVTDTVQTFDTIPFTYADGPRDAEAFLVDNNSRDIYIITKREANARLYKIAWPYSMGSNTANFIQAFPYTGVVSAAMDADGKNILVKTYTDIYYYNRGAGLSIPAALQQSPVKLAYRIEPQGEALCFARDNSGFFTLSEKGLASAQSLYFYKRK